MLDWTRPPAPADGPTLPPYPLADHWPRANLTLLYNPNPILRQHSLPRKPTTIGRIRWHRPAPAPVAAWPPLPSYYRSGGGPNENTHYVSEYKGSSGSHMNTKRAWYFRTSKYESVDIGFLRGTRYAADTTQHSMKSGSHPIVRRWLRLNICSGVLRSTWYTTIPKC